MISSLWSRFDHKSVSLFSKFPERAKAIYPEFARVGLESVIPCWGAPSPYEKLLEGIVKRDKYCTAGYFYVTLQHQQMIRTAYDLGAQHALFFEDDIRFLNDTARVSDIVSALPEDYDVALLDWILSFNTLAGEGASHKVIHEQRDAGKVWAEFAGVDLRSTGAFALSRKGMQTYLEFLEKPALDGSELLTCDCYWRYVSERCRAYCATTCPCVQGLVGGQTGYKMMWSLYGHSKNAVREEYAA